MRDCERRGHPSLEGGDVWKVISQKEREVFSVNDDFIAQFTLRYFFFIEVNVVQVK